MNGYEGDSFFTLTGVQQVGLLGVTAVLSLLMVAIVARAGRPLPWLVAMGLSVLAFYLFVWLSPQIYYAYYRQIFDGLPRQWVVGLPPSPMVPLKMLTFSSQQNLSHHGQGLLGWLMILAPLVLSWRKAVGRDK